MKRKKAALYSPYLDTLGGGEKYALSILKALEDNKYNVSIFWDKDITNEIKDRFNLTFNNLSLFPNIFKKKDFIRKLSVLKSFDIFLYVTDGSYFFSSAKKNIIYAMVPDQRLYRMKAWNRLKLSNWKFITHSHFNQEILNRWGIKSEVLYPFLDEVILKFASNHLKKEKNILSVGRFFKHLHSKKQDEMIKFFKEMKTKVGELKDFKLILTGGFKTGDSDYFNYLKRLIDNDTSIILKPNLPYSELLNLYQRSLIYWHFTGFGIDEHAHPERVEHLGITPLEAMASGCLVFCYAAGGPKELITSGKNGFLFKDKNELSRQLLSVLNNSQEQKRVTRNAQEHVQKNFNYNVFKKKVEQIIL